MFDSRHIFARSESPAHSLEMQARMRTLETDENQFRLLVRHLLGRFFVNEMISIEGEALPLLMTIAYVLALPTLVVALFLFFSYHTIPPRPVPFWAQVGHHYFYVMYSWVVMGGITVFEWDLLFPNMLDVFILSVLPISHRRLLFARILAILILLGLFLIGTSSLGIVFFPLITELPNTKRLFAAHLIAVTAAGICAAAQFLALQGVLINLLGARLFRMVSTCIQGLSMTALLIILFLYPLLSHSLEGLIRSDASAVRYFPPFWFLGMYESLFAGQSALPAFTRLAHTGYWVTCIMVLLAIVTYPLAYRRRTRQAIEGSAARKTRDWSLRPVMRLLYATILRSPSRRAVYHFIGLTLLRTQRHGVYLAMYAGLGIAIMTSFAALLHITAGHITITFSSVGLRSAVPAAAFWCITGLYTALASPADPNGSWVFLVIQGKPSPDQLAAARIWVFIWGWFLTLGVIALLHLAAPPELRGVRVASGQALVATGLCLLLTDIFFLKARTIPFTEARVPRNTDLAFVLLRYIVFFPVLIATMVQEEHWIETSLTHLVATILLVLAAHAAMRCIHWRISLKHADRIGTDEGDELLLSLSLRQ